jgi:hypothetical protein
VLHYTEKRKKKIIFITMLHSKPQGCDASVASTGGPFTTKNKNYLPATCPSNLTQQSFFPPSGGLIDFWAQLKNECECLQGADAAVYEFTYLQDVVGIK